jgi:hypothetical protein
MQTLTFLDPTGTTRGRIGALPGPVPSLEGHVVAILNNRWKAMDLVAERFEAALRRDHGVRDVLQRTIPISGAAPDALLDEVSGRADLAVVGLAN